MNWIVKVLLGAVLLPAVWSIACISAHASEADRNGEVIATLHAEGSQIYECKPAPGKSPPDSHALTWQFREPIAALFADGKSSGRHYAGPNWDHVDGSGVKGKVIANLPGAGSGDIPWLELEVIEHRGNGLLSDAAIVQRVNTKGGVVNGSCESAGSYLNAPYSADYVFRRRK